ncbi:HAD family hydrolase [Streptomyces pathocidini]|uniref:HAD family hydrolase n=1 Tax=Streptomyces pathocidini TaxID=1650571 RepID=A0ABW7US13_9ACTN|nr:HAD family hydrolase [Streptomyces pathocidini]
MSAAPWGPGHPDAAPCRGCAVGRDEFTPEPLTRLAAITVDLDDTLFAQADWLTGAWRTVASAARKSLGVQEQPLYEALVREAALGTDRGGIIDRALAAIGSTAPSAPLVEAFRSYRPASLLPYPSVTAALTAARRSGVPLAVVTDGHPPQQRQKLAALGLAELFDAVVVSDELGGREHRKPSAAPFLEAARLLGVRPSTIVHVGDRPEKDIAGARAAGLLGAVRVRTGEYGAAPCGGSALGCCADAASALIRLVCAWESGERCGS